MCSYNNRQRRTRDSAGFTMLEVLIVIALVAILASIGVPSFRYVTNSSRVVGESNGLLGDLQFARSEAIREGQSVTVCVSTDSATCSAGNSSWNQGWIVFPDPNSNQTVDPGETVLRIQKPFSVLGSTDTFVGGNGLSAVTFNREGFTIGVATGTLITLHDATNNSVWTRCLSVNSVGLMSVAQYNVTLPFAAGTCT